MPARTKNAAKNGVVEGTISKNAPTMLDRFTERLAAEAEIGATEFDGQAIAEQVAERILAAETLEDAVAAQSGGMLSGKDVVNIPLEVTSYGTREADSRFREHGLGYFFVIDAINTDTGEEIQFACGAMNVMLLIWKAHNQGALPLLCVVRSREVANGDLLTLELSAKPTVRK